MIRYTLSTFACPQFRMYLQVFATRNFDATCFPLYIIVVKLRLCSWRLISQVYYCAWNLNLRSYNRVALCFRDFACSPASHSLLKLSRDKYLNLASKTRATSLFPLVGKYITKYLIWHTQSVLQSTRFPQYTKHHSGNGLECLMMFRSDARPTVGSRIATI